MSPAEEEKKRLEDERRRRLGDNGAAGAIPVPPLDTTIPASVPEPAPLADIDGLGKSERVTAAIKQAAGAAQEINTPVPSPAVAMTSENDPRGLSQERRIVNAAASDPAAAQEVLNAKEQETVYDVLRRQKEENAAREAELRDIEKGSERAARWAAVGEAVTAFANSLAVTKGASHQQFRQTSSDWMRQADANRKERLARVASMKDNLLQQELRFEEMKQKGVERMIAAQDKREDRRLRARLAESQVEQHKAMSRLYEAKTANEKAKAQSDLDAAKKRLDLIQSQIDAFNALAEQRRSAANDSKTRANAYASGVENQNQNRTTRTESQGKVDESKVGVNNAREKYWNEKDPNFYAKRKEEAPAPGTSPVAPSAPVPAPAPKEEKKKKSASPSLDDIFGTN